LLYIMFIAGLELDMNDFRANRNKSLLFGFFTFAVPILIGFPVVYYVLDYGFNASFLTASMFATHTLVAYPIVSKYGVAKNQAVAVSVGGTILTDTAVLIILAVIMGKTEGNLDQAFWIRLLVSLLIFAIIMFVLIPRISKWFFRRLASEKHAHYIYVLSVVFFAAFLSEVAGVDRIIGAFVAGLALNPLIPQSSALMNRIEFIGNALFIPFFLISVGMLVDISVILEGATALIVAATLTVVALVGKWLAAWFAQMAFKYTRAQRRLIFGLSSAHAAATIAIILVGFQAGILDKAILNGTIILILITCLVASFATERAAKKIALSDDSDEAISDLSLPAQNEHILIPVANFASVEPLVDFSGLIKDKKSANPVTLLSVVPNNDEAELNLLRYRKQLEQFVRQGSANELKINTVATIDHNTSSGIARTAKELMADIVVIGWPHKPGFLEKIFGDMSDSITNSVDRNLFICRFVQPMVACKRVVLVVPPLAEREAGFGTVLGKVFRTAQELSLPVVLYAEKESQEMVLRMQARMKSTAKVYFKEFSDWEDFLVLSREIQRNDLLMFVSARKDSVAYLPVFDKLPAKFEKHFDEHNLLIVYPQAHGKGLNMDAYDDFDPRPLQKGIEAIENIGKNIGSMFKKGQEE